MGVAVTEEWWQENYYLRGKEIGAGLWICLAPMLFTFRLMVCDPGGVHEFYCYPDQQQAFDAFDAWNGEGDPLPGWVKHYPSMRRMPPRP